MNWLIELVTTVALLGWLGAAAGVAAAALWRLLTRS